MFDKKYKLTKKKNKYQKKATKAGYVDMSKSKIAKGAVVFGTLLGASAGGSFVLDSLNESTDTNIEYISPDVDIEGENEFELAEAAVDLYISEKTGDSRSTITPEDKPRLMDEILADKEDSEVLLYLLEQEGYSSMEEYKAENNYKDFKVIATAFSGVIIGFISAILSLATSASLSSLYETHSENKAYKYNNLVNEVDEEMKRIDNENKINKDAGLEA